MTLRKKRWIAHGVFVCALLLTAQAAVAGTITVTKCGMTDKTNGGLVTSGYADAYLSVEFVGEANCDCETPDITYTWLFGDGTDADGATVSHVYGYWGAGKRSPWLLLRCIAALRTWPCPP